MAKFIANANDNGPGPTVMVYIGHDDPSRGDSHGMKGIGQRLAQKLGGHFLYAEDKHLYARYATTDKNVALRKLLEEFHKPDILLTSPYVYFTAGPDFERDVNERKVFVLNSFNEGLANQYSSDHKLVAHHITPEMFAEESVNFRQHYPDVTGTVVAVLAMQAHYLKDEVKKIVAKAGLHNEATIFLCSSRHTSEDDFLNLQSLIRKEIRAQGLSQKVKSAGYFFYDKGKSNYNPYIGLLDQADVILAPNSSQSMASESLATGKRVYLFGGSSSTSGYHHLYDQGKAINFSLDSELTSFDVSRIEPINVTDEICQKMAETFRADFARNAPHPMKLDPEAEDPDMDVLVEAYEKTLPQPQKKSILVEDFESASSKVTLKTIVGKLLKAIPGNKKKNTGYKL